MPLGSHPVPTAEQDEDAEIEEHRTQDVSITVTQSPGFLCHISATARIPLPPRVLWESCIAHPDNAALFRHIDRCTLRRFLPPESHDSPEDPTSQAENPPVSALSRCVEVRHEAEWRFMLFSGKFVTHLLVEESDEQLIMRFELLKDSKTPVKKFTGAWHIHPHPEDPYSSLSTLEQDLALGVWLPPPLDKILKSIACLQVRKIFEDLQKEAACINRGRPTLAPYAQVKDAEIGV